MKVRVEVDGLVDRIRTKDVIAGVVGLGYVGLPLACELAAAGYRVLGFDISEETVSGVNRGESHIRDVPSSTLASVLGPEGLEATSDMSRLVECDTISICVPTPLGKTRDPDVSYVAAAASAVAQVLRPGQLIVLESTTYPGTTRDLVLPILEESGLEVGRDFFLCFSPERVDPGNPTWTTKNTPKVIGGITPSCLEAGEALYGEVIERVVPVSSTEAAELTKLLENTFRSINIALVNEMAQVADRLGVDVWEVIDAAATKPFGFMKFVPGPGIGGHCIPLDPHYLVWKMKMLDYKTRMVELATEINAEMPRFVVNKIQDGLNRHRRSVAESRILILGVAYKRDIDDVRESPALDVIRLLAERGAEIRYHDPYVPVLEEDGIRRESVPLTDEELSAADCVVITTDHSTVDYERVVRLAPLVVDTRNATRGIEGGDIVGLGGNGTEERKGRREEGLPTALMTAGG